MLPSTPDLIVHTTDVSDTHTVACTPDCPARPCPLYLQTDKPRPAPGRPVRQSASAAYQSHHCST